MGAPPLFVIVGAPAVGKSSTARAVAAAFDRSLHVPVDDLRHMVHAGLVLPEPDWTDELVLQLGLARRAALAMAGAYRAAGFAVVLDDFVDPPGLLEYAELAGAPGVVRVCLRPDRDVAMARNRARSNSDLDPAYLDRGIRVIYDQLDTDGVALDAAGWVMLDNSEVTVDETARRIVALA